MERQRSPLLDALCVGVAVLALGAGVVLAVRGSATDWVALGILATLCCFAGNTSVALPNGSALSASFMLAIAAIVVFRADSNLFGPLVVGAAGGVHFPQLRDREWRKFLFNVGSLGLSALAAASVYAAVPANVVDSVPGELAAAIPTALTYSLVNFAFLTFALALSERRSIREVADELWLGDLQIYPFAIMGVLLGRLYLDVGPWVVPLFVAPILIARQAFTSYITMRRTHDDTIATLIRVLEAKDSYTAGHVERVARYAQMIGADFGFRMRRLEALRYAALMHDIGKLIVPNQILRKPGRLTKSEFDRMRRHEPVSVELLRRINFLAPIAPSLEVPGDHASLTKSQSLDARIVAVADAFDAMTSTRAYRQALSQDVAFRELRDKVGSQFDAECVEALIRVVERGSETFGAGFETNVTEFDVTPPRVGTGSAGLGDLEVEEPGVLP